MDETIELIIDSKDGIIDCRLEPQGDDTELFYCATILYPNIVDGYSRSEIYCHNLKCGDDTGNYHFEGEDIHPKILKLESQLAGAIKKHMR